MTIVAGVAKSIYSFSTVYVRCTIALGSPVTAFAEMDITDYSD